MVTLEHSRPGRQGQPADQKKLLVRAPITPVAGVSRLVATVKGSGPCRAQRGAGTQNLAGPPAWRSREQHSRASAPGVRTYAGVRQPCGTRRRWPACTLPPCRALTVMICWTTSRGSAWGSACAAIDQSVCPGWTTIRDREWPAGRAPRHGRPPARHRQPRTRTGWPRPRRTAREPRGRAWSGAGPVPGHRRETAEPAECSVPRWAAPRELPPSTLARRLGVPPGQLRGSADAPGATARPRPEPRAGRAGQRRPGAASPSPAPSSPAWSAPAPLAAAPSSG